jgi:redox-sensing transcriptional repressor
MFGITGNRRGGYNVDELTLRINDILGKNDLQKVVVVGVGNIGKALLRYKGFESSGIKVMAAFDIDPVKFDSSSGVPILPLDDFRSFIQEHDIKIGILSVPEAAAHHISEIMVSAGIKGILNFAPIQLRAEDDVVISNINLEVELENLIYFVNAQKKPAKA